MIGRIGIDDVAPLVSAGHFPAKAVVGETVPVSATVWREGHDAVNATLHVEGPGRSGVRDITMTAAPTPDRFDAVFAPDAEGFWTFRVDAWSDPYATWRSAVSKKVAAGQGPAELANDLETGARVLDRAATAAQTQADVATLRSAAAALRSDADLGDRIAPALGGAVTSILAAAPVRDLLTKGRSNRVWVDRKRALFGSWYEFFPRSTGGWDADGKPVHGTFRTSLDELPRIADMGFDVVYLPPIHPIGRVNRKGRNNTLTPGPEDVGVPWAIGSAEGGHDAIHPQLGDLDDFRRLVERTRELGMEIALDYALQAAPDHPWTTEHPEWFTTQPDGTIAYAENPPKKYQDIYPINFDNDRQGIYAESLRILLYWIDQGVKIFRVDNPHTKTPDFWEWTIVEVKKRHPDVLFLAEAFTRPARMYGLAKLGYTQSYTYFTWRTSKAELTEFALENVKHADEFRPNLFVNTPDILPEHLQHGGPGMFALRAALAATLAPTWGVYAGYELYEHLPIREGAEEYLNSEKYELRPRDFAAAAERGESLEPWLRRLNEIRRAHPALQQLRNIHFHNVENESIIAYSKHDPTTGDCVLVVVNLNPFAAESSTLWIDMPAIGRDWHDRFTAVDEVSGEHFHWGQANFVRLEPWKSVAHIVALPPLSPRARIERSYRKAD